MRVLPTRYFIPERDRTQDSQISMIVVPQDMAVDPQNMIAVLPIAGTL